MEEVTKDAERAIGRKDAFRAAQATGYEPVPPTGDKEKDKHIAEGQRLRQLRVLPAGPGNPSYISELTQNPVALERQRDYLGISQAASSSGPAEFNISTPRTKPKAKTKSKGTKAETNEPETSIQKPIGRPPGSKNNPK